MYAIKDNAIRGRYRNIEGRGHMYSVQGVMNPFMSGSYMHCRRQCIEVRSANQSTQSAEKFFHLHFQLSELALVAPLYCTANW